MGTSFWKPHLLRFIGRGHTDSFLTMHLSVPVCIHILCCVCLNYMTSYDSMLMISLIGMYICIFKIIDMHIIYMTWASIALLDLAKNFITTSFVRVKIMWNFTEIIATMIHCGCSQQLKVNFWQVPVLELTCVLDRRDCTLSC